MTQRTRGFQVNLCFLPISSFALIWMICYNREREECRQPKNAVCRSLHMMQPTVSRSCSEAVRSANGASQAHGISCDCCRSAGHTGVDYRCVHGFCIYTTSRSVTPKLRVRGKNVRDLRLCRYRRMIQVYKYTRTAASVYQVTRCVEYSVQGTFLPHDAWTSLYIRYEYEGTTDSRTTMRDMH